MQKLAIAAALLLSVASHANAATIEERYTRACAACHNTGAAGAPKKGDKVAWASRVKGGEALMLERVKKGYKAMPPKGLCNDCTDAEFKAIIKYMSK